MICRMYHVIPMVPEALVAQWIKHLHVEQKVWDSTPTGRRYQLGGFLTARASLYSFLGGTVCFVRIFQEK